MVDFVFWFYFRTHTLQYQTHSTSICLENLTEGSQYKFCIVETLYTCKSSSWNCIIKTIPTIQRSINHYQKSINQLQIKNLGYNWLQLTWLPISQTLYWQINEIPIGYLIVAMGKFKTIHCTDRIYSIQAPWVNLCLVFKLGFTYYTLIDVL